MADFFTGNRDSIPPLVGLFPGNSYVRGGRGSRIRGISYSRAFRDLTGASKSRISVNEESTITNRNYPD